MPRGGARPGAGRKSKNEQANRAIQAVAKAKAPDRRRQEIRVKSEVAEGALQDIIGPWLPGLAVTLRELAEGVWYKDPILGQVYETLPSIKAITYLIDRVAGRPKQASDGPDINTVTTLFEYQAQAEREVLDRELDPGLSRRLREQIQQRFAELISSRETEGSPACRSE